MLGENTIQLILAIPVKYSTHHVLNNLGKQNLPVDVNEMFPCQYYGI